MKRNRLPVMTGSVPGAKNSSPARFLRRWLTGNATRKPRLAFLILAPLLFLSACSGGGGDNNAVTPPTPATFIRKATLTLSQDVPAPTALAAANVINGTTTVTLNTPANTISGTLTITGDIARVTAAHIQDGEAGVAAGNTIIDLQNNGNGVWAVPAGTTLTNDQAARFEAGEYCVLADTALNANGEIRGQLISFADNIQPIFTANCAVSVCHVDSGVAPMSLAAGEAFKNLVNNGALVEPGVRVIPNDSADSVLFKKVSGTTAGPEMPIGASPLPASEQGLIKVWIDMGAENN
jgi:predicted RecA/RadA family phage recombinase